jgi:hypothetical protein
MTLSLNVLNHLGIKLYSNLPAVLSEAVANAWDADATRVEITVDVAAATITITDNGNGMTPEEVNARFLHVGYRRREDDADGAGSTSPRFRRPVMGRKGLGKLSLFSIARVVEVQTAAVRPLRSADGTPAADAEVRVEGDGTSTIVRCGFRMDLGDIEAAIQGEQNPSQMSAAERDSLPKPYFPVPIGEEALTVTRGTTIVLKDLKKDPAKTAAFLRRRLARRFSMLSPQFELSINGAPVSPQDRDLTKFARYIWLYGPKSYRDQLRNELGADVVVEDRDTLNVGQDHLYGWIGTARVTTELQEADEEGENLNRIAILVRGKLAQEDVLRGLQVGGLFNQYLIGEIHADFLDTDDGEDIATSARQAIVEDDPRFEALLKFTTKEVRYIGTAWNKLREKDGEKDARKIKAVDDWFKTLQGDDRKDARRFFGRLNTTSAEGADKTRLIGSGVIAFESLRRRRRLSALADASDESLPALISAFESMDDIEAATFYDVVKDRIEIIRRFENLVTQDAKERVLQQYLFDHLWLLDPSWERTTTPVMESAVKSIIDDPKNLDDEILRSRVDIAYRRTAGTHVIVELKRASVGVSSVELVRQVDKYRSGILAFLRRTEGDHVDLRIVCVLGDDPTDYSNVDGVGTSRLMLGSVGARAISYSTLINNALASYEDYLTRYRDLGTVRAVIAGIEDELASDSSGGDSDQASTSTSDPVTPPSEAAAEPEHETV